ncbi:MAG: ATP synthase F1 subunit delta [Actinomycetia bacterium]|nr:ATP synthase F1 subunit delta [Actinomycetes bacterium]
MTDRIEAYAEGLLTIARAEGNADTLSDELFRFARALEGNDELRNALTDPRVPVDRRQQVVEDLLGAKASDVTTAAVSMVVGSGRAAELLAIADAVVAANAHAGGKAVAEVRSAVALSTDQQSRLATALSASTGGEVEVKNVVDPSLVGGIVTQIGDTVIDGSLRSRLAKLRESF